MPTATETTALNFHGWNLRVRPPLGETSRGLLVLLHGWRGSEDVMWVFAHKLPRDRWVISPRGIVAGETGYGWASNEQKIETPIDAFLPACAGLEHLISEWQAEYRLESVPMDLIGFSQGAALTYCYSLVYPSKVRLIAGLAGFLPQGASRYFGTRPLAGKHALVAHGTRDDIVPIQHAEAAVQGLELAGAAVDYCTSDVGHKLGSPCLRSLEAFFTDHSSE